MVNPLTFLNVLWAVPVLTAICSRRKDSQHVRFVTAVSFGVIVCPASFGLYSLYFTGAALGIPGTPLVGIGLVGFASLMFHASLPYDMGTTMGLIPENTVIEGMNHFRMFVFAAVVWSLIYGAVGAIIDLAFRKRTKTGLQ